MEFFVPAAKDNAQAKRVWAATRKFAEQNLQRTVSDRRIFSVAYRHNGREYYAEVGKPDPRVEETVLVILESNPFLVCTQNRGVIRGLPVLVGRDEILRIVDFDT